MFLSPGRLVSIFLFLLLASPVLAGHANVFVYHRFGDARYPSTNIPLQVFSAQLEHLQRLDYTVLPLGEIVRRIRAGESLPERCAALTVDDAYDSFLTGAMPLLRRYGYPATLFVSTDLVGHRDYLGWDQLKSLKSEGVEIANHSASHGYLLDRRSKETPEEWRSRVKEDILRAQDLLAKELGERPTLFAYPFGEYSPGLVELVSSLGFSGAAAQQSGVVTETGGLFSLPRFPMGGAYATLEGFKRKLVMRALPVSVIEPRTPVIGERNPPELIVEIPSAGLDLRRLSCYVPGQENARVVPVAGESGRFSIQAAQPLTGRRSKYTLTAPGREGGWYWFSQLWVRPQVSER